MGNIMKYCIVALVLLFIVACASDEENVVQLYAYQNEVTLLIQAIPVSRQREIQDTIDWTIALGEQDMLQGDIELVNRMYEENIKTLRGCLRKIDAELEKYPTELREKVLKRCNNEVIMALNRISLRKYERYASIDYTERARELADNLGVKAYW